MSTVQTFIKPFAFIIFLLVIGGYTAFELRTFFTGPSLSLEQPIDGATTKGITVVQGTAQNVTFLYLNGRQIYTDESGSFQEHVLFPRGYNTITLRAVGKFNKEVTKTISLISS